MARKHMNTQQSPSLPLPPGTVELRRRGQYLDVYPPVKGLEQYLYTVQHVRCHDAQRGAAILPQRDELVWRVTRRGETVQRTFGGFKPLVEELLDRNGLSAVTTGKGTAQLPEPDFDQLGTFKRVDRALLDFIREHERGMVIVERQGKVSVARLVAQIALAWPKKWLVVLVTRVEEARRLARHLRKFLPQVGLVNSKDKVQQPKRRLVVVTPAYLRRGDVAAEKRSICIALNPTDLFGDAHNQGADLLPSLRNARIFGVQDMQENPAPRLRDLLTALFGPDEILIPRHGHRPLDVEVVFSPIRGGGRPPDHKSDALIKRLGVHEHRLRNRRIWNLAQALEVNALHWLKADYPEVAERLGEKVGRVGVLVDHVPHGLTLAKKLNWPFVVGMHFCEDGLSEEEKDLIELGKDEHLRTKRSVVVTGNGLKRAGWFDVLIRADGGVGLPGIPLNKLSSPDDELREMLLVDFRDEHHPRLRKWSRQRRVAYDEAGWAVVGHEVSELDRFLNSRPKVV